DQARLVQLGRLPVLQLGDRFALWIIFVGDVAVAPGEDTYVDVAGRDIGQTFVQRALVGRDVILHGDHIVTSLTQDVIDRVAVVLEIAEGRGDVDIRHPGLL